MMSSRDGIVSNRRRNHVKYNIVMGKKSYGRLVCLVLVCSLIFVVGIVSAEGPSWVPSVNMSKWYTALDMCILNNSSRVDIDFIIEDCKKDTENAGSMMQVPRCTVGNAWRGPAKSPFCSAEDIPYTERSHFRNSISGYDDPSQSPLEEFFTKLSRKKGALLLIGDSVQQQFMGAMACELEREGVWKDPKDFWNTDEVKFVTPRGTGGSISELPPVPIKFAAIYHLVNGRYDRIANASMHAMRQAVGKFTSTYDTVVIVINMGLHYVPTPVQHFSRSDYNSQMHTALSYLNSVAIEQAAVGKEVKVLWRETTAQHFDTPNGCTCMWCVNNNSPYLIYLCCSLAGN
jgi:hypothetical protein